MSGLDALWAFERYEAVRARLPAAAAKGKAERADNLGALAEEFDAFVLDAFGVINVGETAIEGAAQRIASLKALGKTVLVLTNGATVPGEATAAKYEAMGLPLDREEVISSRDALADALAAMPEIGLWGVAAAGTSRLESLPAACIALDDEGAGYADAEGFVLLSSAEWSDDRQARLCEALAARPRPVLVGNPDLVAPREWGFSAEPGYYAHLIADAGLGDPRFFGKPFQEVYGLAAQALEARGVNPARVCMVGDTLHTDVLGGAAAGWSTVLVTAHGLYKDLDPADLIERSGIAPDYLVPSI